ncbi:immunity 52 family protein [Myxococcaceae bacterium GXIMD 01537]
MNTHSAREETYFAGAYWGLRKESPEECARRLEQFLVSLPELDPAFAHWFQLGKSRKAALKRPIHSNRSELARLVLSGRDRTFEDLGFRISGWNGSSDDHDAIGFNIHCGGYTDVVYNTCVFDLPGRGPDASRVLTSSVLSGLVRRVVTAWEPDSAVATSSSHLQRVEKGDASLISVGWVTYLARHRGSVPPLPDPVRVEPVEDKGTLIVLTPERFTASNPDHVALAEQVHEQLDRAGMLKPLQLKP